MAAHPRRGHSLDSQAAGAASMRWPPVVGTGPVPEARGARNRAGHRKPLRHVRGPRPPPARRAPSACHGHSGKERPGADNARAAAAAGWRLGTCCACSVDATPLGPINHLAVDHPTLTAAQYGPRHPARARRPRAAELAGAAHPPAAQEHPARGPRPGVAPHRADGPRLSGATGTCSPWAWPIPGCAPGHGNSPKG